MQTKIKSRLLQIINSGMMNSGETKAFPEMYKRDTYQPRAATPRQVAWINKVYARIFEGVELSENSLFPTKLGDFEIVRKGADFYLEINGVPIPEPISKRWGQELVQYLFQAHKCGALVRGVKSLIEKDESAVVEPVVETKINMDEIEDPF